ncbi:ribosome-binding protein 1 [Babesia caballi]|uniref:Ribosome-binding protein 1 n=1 Tax=Babesia caballi TaxID=5871 RepID=A0AAV4LNQ1_BABCB|nr:ribosome-binding protein 1 [Babesia caballi]
METCYRIDSPDTVKKALEFGSAIQSNTKRSEILQQVAKEINKRLKEYDVTRNNIKQELENVIQGVDTLRKKIVDNGKQDTYEKYSYLTDHISNNETHCECVKSIVEIVINIFPRLQATLRYLLYEVDTDPVNKTAGGGDWAEHRCDGGPNNAANHDTLNEWLITTKDDFYGYFDGVNAELPGGYPKDNHLSQLLGSDLVQPLKSLVDRTTGSLSTLLTSIVVLLPHESPTKAILIGTFSTATVLGGAAAAVATNFMNVGSALYALLGLA